MITAGEQYGAAIPQPAQGSPYVISEPKKEVAPYRHHIGVFVRTLFRNHLVMYVGGELSRCHLRVSFSRRRFFLFSLHRSQCLVGSKTDYGLLQKLTSEFKIHTFDFKPIAINLILIWAMEFHPNSIRQSLLIIQNLGNNGATIYTLILPDSSDPSRCCSQIRAAS